MGYFLYRTDNLKLKGSNIAKLTLRDLFILVNFDSVSRKSEVTLLEPSYDFIKFESNPNQLNVDEGITSIINNQFQFEFYDIFNRPDNYRDYIEMGLYDSFMSEYSYRLNLYSLPEIDFGNQTILSLKELYSTSVRAKKENDPFSCSIFFNEKDQVVKIEFNIVNERTQKSISLTSSSKFLDVNSDIVYPALELLNYIPINFRNWRSAIDKDNFSNERPDYEIIALRLIKSIYYKTLDMCMKRDNQEQESNVLLSGSEFQEIFLYPTVISAASSSLKNFFRVIFDYQE